MKTSRFVNLSNVFLSFALAFMSIAQARVALAAPSDQDTTVTTISSTAAQQKAALTFWTRDALAKAQPMEMPVDSSLSGVDTTAIGAPETVGEFGSTPPGLASASADSKLKLFYATDWKTAAETTPVNAIDSSIETFGTSQVYTSYYANYWSAAQTIYPHKWVGRLSYKTSSGSYYCSATAISNNHIVTAAHCVYDSTANVWFSNWVFTPAYRNGSAPYGTFPYSSCTILTNWKNLSGNYAINTWARYDVAVCGLAKNSAGLTLNQAVGWAGRSWNASYDRSFHTLGYPSRDTNNNLLSSAGLYLRLCTAESFQQTTDTLGMGCNFGRGMSGGPWLISYAPYFAQGYVNSVVSGGSTGTANDYGIRFTSNNIVLVCNTEGC